jgi:acyl carrier protein
MQPVPVGLPGELLIGGCAVARGYLGRPDLTAERFVPDPFVADGGRLYRTGDRVRWRPDRTLEFLGRLDAQLKVRGFRVEPAEVEAALVAHPAVAQAAVCVEPDESAPSLIAYLVPDADVDLPLAGELRRFLTAYLPDPLVPTRFTAVEALPLTAAGKIDRRALAGRRGAAVPTGVAFVPPSTPTEQALAGIWRELLGTERVGIDDDFFDLGGHSLLATQVISRIRAGFDVEPALATLFDHPSLGQLANAIDTLVWAADTDLSAPETVGPDREEIAL